MRLIALLSLIVTMAMPTVASAQARMTKEQLIAYATERNFCEDRRVVDVNYIDETSNRVRVECEEATGIVPLAGGFALGGGAAAAAAALGLAAAAAGGGGSSGDTQ